MLSGPDLMALNDDGVASLTTLPRRIHWPLGRPRPCRGITPAARPHIARMRTIAWCIHGESVAPATSLAALRGANRNRLLCSGSRSPGIGCQGLLRDTTQTSGVSAQVRTDDSTPAYFTWRRRPLPMTRASAREIRLWLAQRSSRPSLGFSGALVQAPQEKPQGSPDCASATRSPSISRSN